MTFISYAQNFEDVMLWRAFKDVRHGFYIDLGAQDPVLDSVTLAFHQRGWRGVHVEPSAHYAEMLRQQRPGDLVIQAAISSSQGLVRFFEIKGSGISTSSRKIAARHRRRGFEVHETLVPGIPLSAVFEACNTDNVHWLKMDIEGSERIALESWEPNSIRPFVVVVESTQPLSQVDSSHEWEQLLLEREYEQVYFDGLNRYFLAIERKDLKAAFQSPPNVFDGFAISGTSSSGFHSAIEERHRKDSDLAAAEVLLLKTELEEVRSATVQRERAAAEERESLLSSHRAAVESVRRGDEEIASMQSLHAASTAAFELRLGDLADGVRRADDIAAHFREALRLAQEREAAASQRRDLEVSELLGALSGDLQRQQEQHAAEVDRQGEHIERQASQIDLISGQLLEAGAQREALALQLAKLTDEFGRAREALLHSHAGNLQRLQEQSAAEVDRLSEHIGRQASQIDLISGQLTVAAGTIDRIHRSPAGKLLSLLGRPIRREPATGEVREMRDTGQASPSGEVDSDPPQHRESEMLNSFLALNDVEFVRAAYRAALKRDPDPSGERNYLDLLRAGRSKIRILGGMAYSAEGRRAGGFISGLRGALVLELVGRVPLVGPLFLRALGMLRRSPIPDPGAAYQQQSIGIQNTTLDLASQTLAAVREVKRQQDELELAVRRLVARQDEASVTLISLQEQLAHFQTGDWPVGSHMGDIGSTPIGMAPGQADSEVARDVQLRLMRKASAWKA